MQDVIEKLKVHARYPATAPLAALVIEVAEALELVQKDQKQLREYVENWARVVVQLQREVREKGQKDDGSP